MHALLTKQVPGLADRSVEDIACNASPVTRFAVIIHRLEGPIAVTVHKFEQRAVKLLLPYDATECMSSLYLVDQLKFVRFVK